jgi:hypothetical protein
MARSAPLATAPSSKAASRRSSKTVAPLVVVLSAVAFAILATVIFLRWMS